jgi:branched-chain amino acid aminotransferase
LCREELGLTVIERPIDRTEVYLCDELLMTGTAAQITAVTKVDFRPIGTGAMGAITTQLRQRFDDAVRGRNPRFHRWIMAVYPNSPALDRETIVSGKLAN